MAEISTPGGEEQSRIIKELWHEKPPSHEYKYLVSTNWIFKWIDHVTHFDKAVNPGKLTMMCGEASVKLVHTFWNLAEMYPKAINPESFCNKWVRESIWCKWVQWYGVVDGHQLTRQQIRYDGCGPCAVGLQIGLKGDVNATTFRVFQANENCGFIELQLRRLFGVTHDAETQLWLCGIENGDHRFIADRSKELQSYDSHHYQVQYDTLTLTLLQKLMYILLPVYKRASNPFWNVDGYSNQPMGTTRHIFQFRALPFGLTSAPRVFTKVILPVGHSAHIKLSVFFSTSTIGY